MLGHTPNDDALWVNSMSHSQEITTIQNLWINSYSDTTTRSLIGSPSTHVGSEAGDARKRKLSYRLMFVFVCQITTKEANLPGKQPGNSSPGRHSPGHLTGTSQGGVCVKTHLKAGKTLGDRVGYMRRNSVDLSNVTDQTSSATVMYRPTPNVQWHTNDWKNQHSFHKLWNI